MLKPTGNYEVIRVSGSRKIGIIKESVKQEPQKQIRHQESEVCVERCGMSANISSIATVILSSNVKDQYNPGDRLCSLETIVDATSHFLGDEGLIIFPAGWFYTGDRSPSEHYEEISSQVTNVIRNNDRNLTVCFGIDGSAEYLSDDIYARDQIGMVCDRGGIRALARKFYPSNQEIGHINLAENYLSGEQGYPRIFSFRESRFFVAVCHDISGVFQAPDFQNPHVDGIVNLVHCFYPRGDGPSGVSYFARHKFAGASKRWKCPVYGSASFFRRNIPNAWPSGVLWNQGDLITSHWNYSMNPIQPETIARIPIDEGQAVVRMFSHSPKVGQK